MLIGRIALDKLARLVEHKEPIVLIGIPERKITAFIDGYIGRNALRPSSVTDTGTSAGQPAAASLRASAPSCFPAM